MMIESGIIPATRDYIYIRFLQYFCLSHKRIETLLNRIVALYVMRNIIKQNHYKWFRLLRDARAPDFLSPKTSNKRN